MLPGIKDGLAGKSARCALPMDQNPLLFAVNTMRFQLRDVVRNVIDDWHCCTCAEDSLECATR